jgi:hypothetical protein
MYVSINKPFISYKKLLRRSLSALLWQGLKTLISVVSTANITLQRQQVVCQLQAERASDKLYVQNTTYLTENKSFLHHKYQLVCAV